MLKEPTRGQYDYLLKGFPTADEGPPPPVPPRRDEPPRRVRIEIEINRRPAPPRKRGNGFLIVMAIIIALGFLGAAHGEPVVWTSYKSGGTTYMTGTDGSGSWTGTSHQQGFMTYTDVVGPRGQMIHCSSYRQGFQIVTHCDQ